MDEKLLLKEDLNFLEYPNWVLNSQTKSQRFVVEKSHGRYEISSIEGLPTHFDKIVLYCLLYLFLKQQRVNSLDFETTRYQIAKSIFDKAIKDPYQFDRIMKALSKWKEVSIKFEGIFFEGDNHTIRFFGIIDDVIFNKKTKQLYIRFNQQYIEQIKSSQFYKYIDFNEYKRLTKALSARLYEILIKTFKERNSWQIFIQNLAEKLTMQKRENAKNYYPSDVLSALRPAIVEINQKTELKLSLDYDKEKQLCMFKRLSKQAIAQENTRDVNTSDDSKQTEQDPLITLLVNYGISKSKAKDIFVKYSADKIKHKIELLKQNKQAIKNVAAWLIKALDQDWDVHSYNKQLEEQKLIAERAKKQKEKEIQDKKLQALKKEHELFIAAKIDQTYKALPAKLAKLYDTQFASWADEQKTRTNGFAMPDEIYRIKFFQDLFLEEDEQDFDKWLKKNKIAFYSF